MAHLMPQQECMDSVDSFITVRWSLILKLEEMAATQMRPHLEMWRERFMEQLLRDDPVTFEQYYGRGKKSARQSASNILPILVKKGLIEDYHHKQ